MPHVIVSRTKTGSVELFRTNQIARVEDSDAGNILHLIGGEFLQINETPEDVYQLLHDAQSPQRDYTPGPWVLVELVGRRRHVGQLLGSADDYPIVLEALHPEGFKRIKRIGRTAVWQITECSEEWARSYYDRDGEVDHA